MSHKVTIKVSPDIVEAEVKTADPEQVAYVSKYLTRSNCRPMSKFMSRRKSTECFR